MSYIRDPASQTFHSLGPGDLRIAAEAFEAAVRELDRIAMAVEPHSARRALAQLIMESALCGERDPVRLARAALDDLRARTVETPTGPIGSTVEKRAPA